LSLRDRDLISIQQARELTARAADAQKSFAAFSQTQVDAVVEACAAAALEASEQLARMAVEETGYGNVTDKMTKNEVGAVLVPRALRGMKTVGILREDREKGIVEVASPLGVVAAIIPCTNPTSTAIYKTLISLKARNAIVGSPHPSASRCICSTMEVMARAASKAGAPEGLIACMTETTLQGTQELMKQRAVGVILATGGTGLVRAAYSSGKPAYGVGPGNVPAFIERTADVRKAVADIIAGKTFDYGTICSSEQSIVAEEAISAAALEECRKQGAYFLSPEEASKLGEILFDVVRHVPNAKFVGRPATIIADLAGIRVPPATRVLIARLEPDQVGREHPLSGEKLSPILAFYVVKNSAQGIELCQRLLAFGGAGHTCAVHTQSEAFAREFGAAVPAFRVCVNTPAVHGSVGFSTNLFPAMTLGCGAPGGNITSDNIGPQHLMNVKRIAWGSRGVEHRTIAADQRLAGPAFAKQAPAGVATAGPAPKAGAKTVPTVKTAAAPPVSPADAQAAGAAAAGVLGAADRQLIAQVVERVMAQQGIRRSAVAAQSPEPAANPGLPSAKEVAAAATAAAFAGSPKAASLQPVPVAVAPEEKPAGPKIAPFVSEGDVRLAITRQEKIFIGPKTIVTPSARDLASAHEVLVEMQPPSSAAE